MIEIKDQNFYNNSFDDYLEETFPHGVIDHPFHLEGCTISTDKEKAIFDVIIMAYYPLRWIIQLLIRIFNSQEMSGKLIFPLLKLKLIKVTKFYGYYIDPDINVFMKNNQFIYVENNDVN